ncbi:hypothetical protein ACVWZL_009068 [Bradyrhizobium sp. GM2.4]
MKNVAVRDGALPAGYLRSGDAAKEAASFEQDGHGQISKAIASLRQDCS